MNRPDPQTALDGLRARAEQRQWGQASPPPEAPPEVQRLVQELQTHQLELEMQYEELQHTQLEVETSRAEYAELYDAAPVGYCTLTPGGTLRQLNRYTSRLLGEERSRLLGRRLVLFVAPAERGQFANFLSRLWASPGKPQSCELPMRRADEQPFFAQLEGIVTPDATCKLVLLDVSERRRATDELAARESRFRATFEQSHDGMVLLREQRVSAANAAALRLLGLPDSSQLLGRALGECWPERQPDGSRTHDLLTACLGRTLARGWCRIELLRYQAEGKAGWDELSFSPLIINGQTFVQAIWRDITARRQSEQQLRESETRLQLALAAAGTGVWSVDVPTSLLRQDDRARAIFGLSGVAEGQALPFALLQAAVHPADLPGLLQGLAAAQRDRTAFDLEHRLLLPGGALRYLAVTGRYGYDERTGQPQRLTGLVRDITDRRLAEEALSYQSHLLGNLLGHLPVLLCRIGPDGRYREQAGQVLRRLGLADNELRGQAVAEVFPGIMPYIGQVLAGQSVSYEARLERGGQWVYVQSFGFFYQAQQEAVVFSIDITEPARLKEEATRLRVRQQQQLHATILTTQEEERRRIAEGLHNGVGQLLYATRLHLDLLPPTEATRASQQLLNEAIKATRSISFELTPPVLAGFGLAAALRELVSRLPACRPVADLHLCGLEAPLPALLETAVYRIVQELLNNVMKHAQAQEVFVSVAREADGLHLSVEDDGVGFDPAARPPGQGIGLASIRTRVDLLGGTLSVKSRPGRGTGFFLQLPLPPGPAQG